MKHNVHVLTNGTDNHLLVVDVMKSFGLTGRMAESLLRSAHLTVNRNAVPQDSNGPWYTSGIRLGTPALTTLGMKKEEMGAIASIIADLLKNAKPEIAAETGAPSRAKAHVDNKILEHAKKRVSELLGRFVLYPELAIDEK
jgi:glycine hydroxymethyltransferase